MKKALITYKKKISIKVLEDHKRKLKYDKFFILTTKNSLEEKEMMNFKKFKIIVCTRKEIPNKIDKIFKDYEDKFILFPYFAGDVNSKYAIKIYNKTYNLKINPQSFRIKSKMNEFLGDEITQKKNRQVTYKEIQKMTYKKIINEMGENFILKPTNAASSILNFKITSEKIFEEVKTKLTKKYQYVIEEYLEGALYSLDFYCNGKNIFLLNFVREIPFLEMIGHFSDKYMKKYEKCLSTDFLNFLPIRYTRSLGKISNFELDYIKRIGEKLSEKNYCGFIHLEYKVRRKDKKIGFIEWGARNGWKRDFFIDKMYQLRVENIPVDILCNKDYSRFEKKKGLYFLKNRDIDKNFIGIQTAVIEKTHVLDILNKTPHFLNISMEDFLKNFLWDKWKIKISKIDFFLSTSPEGYLYPFYERSDAKLKYILHMEELSFKKFVSNKHKILESLVFHDYNI